ncbi:DNA photolyase family protein [Acetobacter cerevisiae]|uniref:DNA photolyase family protein n=1 Tax=Acetobacter cerevisiae TaxID=178900 RepID=A0ABT1ERM1_9PROT|nr:deoxyribodipyrimidine photo-lyase [Acetobacter cerevisiae]MCP1246026.1 DNA photolyase family protein [Acetobacter cerevisiae]MCP1255744.1 DNA photolyase family protein [Acetobacter cerevisiae]
MTASIPPSPVLVLFRDDFRLSDNPALHAACATGQPVLCAYVQDEACLPKGVIGWWLGQAAGALAEALGKRGGTLLTPQGETLAVVQELAKDARVSEVFWNRRYDPVGKEIDTILKATLTEQGVAVQSLSARLLHEPWAVRTGAGQPYRIFTAWWRAARELGEPGRPLPAPQQIQFAAVPEAFKKHEVSTALLKPALPEDATQAAQYWPCSEENAHTILEDFLDDTLAHYETDRDRPDREGTSGLSPYLRAGLISARQIWQAARKAEARSGDHVNTEKFLSELGWRDFGWMQLFYEPQMPTRNLRSEFDQMPWQNDPEAFTAWTEGRTGYPLVDAGMRELRATGTMHNRVRMVVASFLTKHLLTDWRKGERWFYERLVDADPALNAMNWQWCAGTGIDASPWFRIFNPVGQSEKFDPSGAYIRTWVPELAGLPDKLIHTPWKINATLSRHLRFVPGTTYPHPIVELKQARAIALESYKNLKGSEQS